jgi:membrane associated rhomboid family serine protease
VFPLRDDVPSRRFPLMTWALIAANALAFVHELRLSMPELERLVDVFGLVPARLVSAFEREDWRGGAGEAATVLSSMFLHGGWVHLLSNMVSLWIFGDNVEDRMGSVRFLAFDLLGGALASALHVWVHPASTLPTIGASGAIAGVMGAYLLLYPRARVLMLVLVVVFPIFVHVPAVVFLPLWFLGQFFQGTLALDPRAAHGGVAWWAHVGGFAAGVLLHYAFLDKRGASRQRA